MKKKLLLAAVATLTVAEFAAGGVRYAINGGTSLLLPTNRIITVGTVTDAMLLHIFDATGNVDESVSEQIVVRGSATSGGSIRVQVASAAEGDAFEFDPRRSLAAGLRNFGGIRFENASNSSDTSLRDHAVVAVAVAGDVTGDIDAGQIFRVDALAYEDSEEQVQGGRILGDITAHNLDSSIIDNSSPALSGGVGAIAYVRAGREISGNITATGTDAFDAGARVNYASIGRVVVGPVESATGIQGNIKAERGSIGSIFTVGPIGADATESTAARTPQIYAGDTIIEILAADEASVAELEPAYRAANFRADVRADVAVYATDGFVFQEGALLLLRTDGDVSGTGIHAGNICQPFEPEVPSSLSALVVGSSTGQVGIYARGTVRVPITIDHIVQGNIIAKTFTEPIIIGRMLEGAVIAWSGLGGGTDGDATLNSLRIGLDEPPDSPTGSPTYAYDGKWSRCFTGKDSGCFPSLTSPDPADPDSINPNVEAYYQNVAQECEEGAGPSVIAANRAGAIAISRMTVWEAERGTTDDAPFVYSHDNVPTIECQRIDTLQIDELREGAVWSGLFDGSGSLGDGSETHANTVRANDYARVGEVLIGCMGDGAALWVMDVVSDDETPTLVAPLSLHVTGNVHGAIYLPALSPTASITIDGSLASGMPGSESTCGCGALDVCEGSLGLGAQDSGASSPRETGTREAGLIAILGARGLKGRIIINAANDGGSWTEDATITVGSVTLSPNAEYSGSSLLYGGGAVGVVPFSHYADDAFPPRFVYSSTPVVPTIRSVEAGSAGALRLRFYGGIAAPPSSTVGAAVRVLRRVTEDPMDADVYAPVTGWTATIADVPFNNLRSELQITWTGSGAPAAATYKVVHAVEVGDPPVQLDALACTGLTAMADPASVPSFEWKFRVSVGTSGGQCYSTDTDYNRDSVVNSDDLGDFIADYFTDPAVAGPGGYAIECPERAPPYDAGWKVNFVPLGVGTCIPPFADNLGDFITSYYGDC